MDVKIEQSWKERLSSEFEKDYFNRLITFVKEEYRQRTIYPPGPCIFSAFEHCPFDKVKVVILGQDPYHEPGQAHGLCFSVQDGTPFPPSLVNIFKEIESDLGKPVPQTGNLLRWADQGVLLLNATYDFDTHKISYMTCNITRDLHCWQMTASFVPVGPYKSYTFNIAVSSSLLKDLKWRQSSNYRDGQKWD